MQTLTQKFRKLRDLGFDTPDFQQIDHRDIEGCFDAKSDRRPHLDYDIDGLVFSIDNVDDMIDFGMLDKKKPKGQIALKFPAETNVVKIIKIHTSYEGGRYIGLIAEFNPVEVMGAVIKRASLKSLRWITENQVGVGTVVEIVRSGDVIPKIEKVISNLEADQSSIPTHCEICGEELDTTQALLACPNDACPAKEAARIRDFLKALKVKGMAWKTWLAYTKEGITLYDIIAKRFDVIERAAKSADQSLNIWAKVRKQLEVI